MEWSHGKPPHLVWGKKGRKFDPLAPQWGGKFASTPSTVSKEILLQHLKLHSLEGWGKIITKSGRKKKKQLHNFLTYPEWVVQHFYLAAFVLLLKSGASVNSWNRKNSIFTNYFMFKCLLSLGVDAYKVKKFQCETLG